MINSNFVVLLILIILALFVFLFMYSALSADVITTCISFMIFLIFLFPIFILIEYLKNFVAINDAENLIFYKIVIFYSTILIVFIGLFFFIQMIYLFLIA